MTRSEFRGGIILAAIIAILLSIILLRRCSTAESNINSHKASTVVTTDNLSQQCLIDSSDSAAFRHDTICSAAAASARSNRLRDKIKSMPKREIGSSRSKHKAADLKSPHDRPVAP